MGQRRRTHDTRRARTSAIALCLVLLVGLAGTFPVRGDETPTPPVRSDETTTPREIRGRVVDRREQPIAAATVHLLRQGLTMRYRDWNPESWVPPVVVRTTKDGNFVAPDLVGNEFRVRVTAPSQAPATLGHVPVGASLTIHLDDGHAVTGRVLDSHARPIAEALVTACDESGLDFGRTTCQVAETATAALARTSTAALARTATAALAELEGSPDMRAQAEGLH